MKFARFAVLLALLAALTTARAQSLLFSNVEAANVGRVEILVDGRPADIGAVDFTIEFWMRSASGNTAGDVGCNTSGYNWISGNIMFDRDRLDGGGRDFGVAIGGGRLVFGVENSGGSSFTICSDSNVIDGAWHHIAIQRALGGALSIYVDGVLEEQRSGPSGNISYPDNVDPGSKQPLLAIGREKYDLGPDGYRGWLDEIRLSNTLRYQGSSFAVPTDPFAVDGSTAALYHLDEGTGDTIEDENGQSPGVRRFSAAAGPEWRTETPFGTSTSPGTLRFSQATYSVNEGVATLTVTVRRVGGSAGAASAEIVVAAGSSATSGADYQFAPVMLSWANGQSAPITRTINVINDTIIEGNETINLALSNVTGAGPGSPNTAVVTITDNDSTAPPAAGVLQFSAATYTVSEATATLTITVTRTGGSSGAASVNVAANGGTATASTDYQIPSAPLTWNDGEATSRTLNITIVNDTAVEGSETITLGLSNVTGAGFGAVASATATINDDDQSTPPPPAPPAAPRSSGGGGAADSLWILFSMYALLRHRNRRSARNAGGCSVL